MQLDTQKLNSYKRQFLLSWLKWNDPNGVYLDSESKAEGMEKLSKSDAIVLIKKQLEIN